MNNKIKKPKKRISKKVKILSASAAIGAGVGFAVAGGSFNSSHQRKLTKFKLTGNYTSPGGGHKTKADIETELKGKPSGQFINIKIGGTDTKYYHVVVAEHVTSTILTQATMTDKKVYEINGSRYYVFSNSIYKTTTKAVGSSAASTAGDTSSSLPTGTIYLKSGTNIYTTTKTQSDGYKAAKSGIYSTATANHSTTEAVIPNGHNYVAHGANTYALEEMYYVDAFTISNENGIAEPSLRTSGNKNTWFTGFTPIANASVDFVSITDSGATGKNATVTYKVSSGAYSQTKTFTISFTKSKQEFANDQALTDLNAAKSTMNTQLNSKTKTGATSDATMDAAAFTTFYGSLPNGVAIDSISWNALDSNKDQKIRKATITLSKTVSPNGTKQTVSLTKDIKFTKSENNAIVSDLESTYGTTGSADLYKDTGTTKLDGTPPTSFDVVQLKALLIANGVTHAGDWNVIIDTAISSSDSSKEATIKFHFRAGSFDGGIKTSKLHYTQTRKAKAEADANAILQNVKAAVTSKLATEVSGYTTQNFVQTNFEGFLGAALNQGVTISGFSLSNASPSSDLKTRTLSFTLNKAATNSGATQTETFTSVQLKFQKSSNEQIIDLLTTSFGTNGSNLYKGTGSVVIAPIPPTTISEADVKALLIANGIQNSGNWSVIDLDKTQLADKDKKQPQIKFKIKAGSHKTAELTSILNYGKSLNQTAVDAVVQSDLSLSSILTGLPKQGTATDFASLNATNGVTPVIDSVVWNSFDVHNFDQTATIIVKAGTKTKTFSNVPFKFAKRKQLIDSTLKNGAQGITFTPGSTTLTATINIPSAIRQATLSPLGIKLQIATDTAHGNWKDVSSGATHVIPEADSLFKNGDSKELWARFVPIDSNVVVLDPNDAKAKVANIVNSIKDHIDTSTVDLSKLAIGGNSHNPTLDETQVTLPDARVEIVYSLNHGSAISDQEAIWLGFASSADATNKGFKLWMNKAEFNALSSNAHFNLAYLDSKYKVFSLTAKLRVKPASASKAIISSEKSTPFSTSKMNGLKKWIDTSSTTASFATIKLDLSKDSHTATWSSSAPTVASIVTNALTKGFEIQYSITSASTGFVKLEAGKVLAQLDDVHANRHLYLKIVLASDPKDLKTTDILSDSAVKDSTASSSIQSIKTRVDTGTFKVGDLKIEGWLNNNSVKFTSTPTPPTPPVGTKIEYSGDGGTTWKSGTDFIAWAKTNTPKRGKIMARLASADDTKYVVLDADNKKGPIDVTKLYSYKDINSLRDLLNIRDGDTYSGSASAISSTGRITFGGKTGVTNGAVFMVPNELTNGALGIIGLKLQYTTDETNINGNADWKDADIKNQQIGGTGTNYANAQLITLNNKTTIEFLALRIVPIWDDEKQAPTIVDKKKYSEYISKTMVKPSDYKTGNGPYYQIDTTKIPKEIVAESSVLSAIKFTGQTRDLDIDEMVQSGNSRVSPQEYLKSKNGGLDYWHKGKNPKDKLKAITILYNFKDGIHDSLWLDKVNFENFLKDGQSIAGEPLTNTAPNWNNIDVTKFTAKWAMLPAKMVTPNDITPKPISRDVTFKKWIDVTAILENLKNQVMDGNTWKLTSTATSGIVTDLDALTGGHNLEIHYSNTLVPGTGDTNTQIDKFDKLHINDAFDLHFMIKVKQGKFLAATTASPTAFNPGIKWDSTKQAPTFKTWVNVDRNVLSAPGNIALSGNTKTLVSSTIKPIVLKSKDGVMSATGSTEGVEIVYKLDTAAFGKAGSVGTNSPMLLPAFKTFLSKLNHNGKWGAKDIRIGYRAKTAYAIPSGMDAVDQKPTITNLKRYIDVSTLVAQLGTIKVKPTSGFADGTHFDSANVEWDMNGVFSPINPDFNTRLEFLLKTTPGKPSAGDANWKKTLPTKLDDDKTKRYLFVKIVNKGKVDGEDLILSDGSIDASGRTRTIEIHDITDTSTIKTTLTNIPLGSLDLTKLKLSGTTKDIVTDTSGIGRTGFLASHAKLYYYIEGTGVTGPGNIPTTKYLEADFKDFMKNNPTTPRTKIRTILIPDAGYTFKPSDINKFKDDAKRKPIITDLYSWYDVSALTPLMTLNVQGTTGIVLTGRAASKVVYDLPPELVKGELALKHLKLQWSITEGYGPTTWNDANTQDYTVPPHDVPGAKTSPNGEVITLKATATSASGHLAFRLVPLQDDLGVAHAPASNSNYDQYVEANKAKPSDYQAGGKAYDIDTSQIPILVNTENAPLSKIKITGNTHRGAAGDLDIKIGGSRTIDEEIKRLNPKATAATLAEYKAQITLEYSIDDQGTRQWLLKDEFLSFLRTGSYVDGGGTTHTLDYAKIKFNSVQVRWTAIELTPRPPRIYVPSDSTPVNLDSSTLRKWIDVQDILDKLKGTSATDKLELSGDTHALVDTNVKFNTILNTLNGIPNPTATNEFEIKVTNKFTSSTTPDFGSSIADSLPSELNDKYQLAFQVFAKNSNSDKFFLGTTANPAVENPSVIWDASTAHTTIKKWIDVTKASLSAVELKGDTKSIAMVVNQDLVSSKDRQMVSSSTPGALIGLEVWYRLTGKTQGKPAFNNNALPQNVFKEYLDGKLTEAGGKVYMPGGQDAAHDVTKYGFTTANYKITHDGSWGAVDIRVGYHAKPGFKIDPNQEVFVTSTKTNNPTHADIVPTITALNRYIDIQPLLDQKDAIKLDDSKYLDSKNLHFVIGDLLKATPGPGDLNGVIYYSIKNTKPGVTDASWTTTITTQIPDTGRKLWVKFVPSKVGSENVNLSDGVTGTGGGRTYESKIYDITAQVKLTDVSVLPTNISISGLHLEQITGVGETNNIVITDTQSETGQNGNSKDHAYIGYSLSDFGTITQAIVDQIGGITTVAEATAAGLKEMMTKAEFLLFVNGDGTATHPKHNIKRNNVKVRLEAETGYSMVPADKDATIKSITNAKLYSFIDVKDLASKLLLEGELTGAVKLQGRIGATDGVVFSFPDEFSNTNLEKINMKLQYTVTPTTSGVKFDDASTDDDQYKSFGISPTADWKDANLGDIPANSIKGFTHVANGRMLTLSKTKNYAFLAFRLVPIKNDENVVKSPSDVQKYSEYITKTMSKPSDLVDSTQAAAPTRNGVFYSINTSKIPTTIFTDSTKLQTITFTGDTRHLIINETTDGKRDNGSNAVLDTIKLLSGNKDSGGNFNAQFLNEVEVVYTIDKDAANQPIWLDKKEMEAYLNGGLEIKNSKVVFKVGGAEVPQLTAVNRAEPVYLDLNIADIRTKWAASKNTGKYSPSQTKEETPKTPEGYDKATKFRKWFDKTPFITDISLSAVEGDTHSYTIDLKTTGGTPSTVLASTFLTKHNLKLQYSNDGTTWTNDKFDFMAANWNVQVARKLKMRVVPIDTKTVIIGEGVGNEGKDNTNTDLLINELEANGDKRFKTYLDVTKAELSAVKTKGSNHELWGYDVNNANDKTGRADLGLLENNMNVKVDDNREKYGELEIMYLYDGSYYNKADLLAEIAKRLNPATLANPPADFQPGNIKAKWRVEHPKNFVIKATEDQDNLIDTSDLREWVNLFSIQERPTDANHKTDPSLPPFTKLVGSSLTADMTEHGSGISLPLTFDLTGDLKELTMNWKAGGLLEAAKSDQSVLNAHHMKVQFSVIETPSNKLVSQDWKDGWPGRDNAGAQVDAVHRSLWIRFVPTDTSKYVMGTSFRSSTEKLRYFVPIKIDTTKVKYSIKLDASKLTGLKFAGTTQKFAKPANAQAIEDSAYNNMNPSTTPGKPNGPQIKDDDRAAGFAIIAYKVKATRTKGPYVAGNDYEFVNETEIATFYADIAKGDLNFDTSTLQVAWRIQDDKAGNNQASQEQWIHPDVTKLQNFVYTEDITTLTDSSYEILGNNIKISIGPLQDLKLDPAELKRLGVKVQYNLEVSSGNLADAKAKTTDWHDWDNVDDKYKKLEAIHDHKNVFIRFVAISTKLPDGTTPKYVTEGDASQVGQGPIDGRQVVRLDTTKSRVAIVLDPTFMSNFNGLTTTGKTAFKDATHTDGFVMHPGGDKTKDIYVDLKIPKVADTSGVKHDRARYQYSIGTLATPGDPDTEIWGDSLEAILKDQYSKGFKSLDKDRDLSGLKIRMKVNDAVEHEYVLTMTDGTEYTEDQRKMAIDIKPLVQPIYTDVSMHGLPMISTWAVFANQGKWKPEFSKGATSKEAKFERFSMEGKDLDADGKETIFKLNQNIYYLGDRTKDIDRTQQKWNALAPRHTHFEFQYRESDSTDWSAVAFTKVPPSKMLKTSTNYFGFKVTLVAGDVDKDGNILDDYKHKAAAKYELPAGQEWSKEFNIVLIKDTESTNVKSIEFLGFETTAGEGIIKRQATNGNPNLGKPLIVFKDSNGDAITNLFDDKAFTLEYRVTSGSGNDVSWTDSNGVTKKGWHEFAKAPIEGSGSYPSPDEEFGYAPTSLKNGQRVYIRLRANDGWVITDSSSTDWNANGYSKWSHQMNYITVQDLKTEISVPDGVRVFDVDPSFNIDKNGHKVPIIGSMPKISFNGNDGSGHVTITTGTMPDSANIMPEVQWLQPWRPKNIDLSLPLTKSDLSPMYGYQLVKKDGSTVVIFTTTMGHNEDQTTSLGWADDFSMIPDSWYDPATLDKLSVTDSLNIRFVAKDGFAFKWEDNRHFFTTSNKHKPWVDLWVPKAHTSHIYNENDKTESYKSVKVNNLLIIPRHKATDVVMGYSPVKIGNNPVNSKPYNGYAIANPSLKPLATDKWIWVYASSKTGSYAEGGRNDFHNGDTFWMKAAPRYSGFKLDPSYDNTPIKFTVSGLTNMINTKFIPKPQMSFEGFIGHANIEKVVPFIEGARTQPYIQEAGKLDQPDASANNVKIHNGVTWEFQISDINPETMNPLDIMNLPWTKDEPKTLKVGQYIRMRVAPKDKIDSVEPPLYSKTNDPKMTEKDGWVKIINLKVDQANIGFEPIIGGFKGKTIITPKMTMATIDEAGITMQAKIESRKDGSAVSGQWVGLRDLKDLQNGDEISYRAIAKKDYVIDPSQSNAFAATNGDVAYIQKGNWKSIPIDSLKDYLNVDQVQLKNILIVRDSRHPKPGDEQYVKQDPTDSTKTIPLDPSDILSGNAGIEPDGFKGGILDNENEKWADGINTIKDVNGVSIVGGVKIQFTVQKYDPDSATYTEISPTDRIPFGLKNMDRVKIELMPVNADKYKLSSERSLWITMKGLVQPSPKLNQPPTLTFMGQNHSGTVLVTPVAQSGFKWVYNVQKIGTPETDVFVNEVPKTLENGDRVRVELASAIAGETITKTYRTKFLTVSNLIFKFDMSNIKIDNPERIMQVVGKQEKEAKIHAIEPEKLTSQGLPIDHTKKMKWKFKVVHEGDKDVPTHPTEFKNKLPEKLVNGDKVYAILVSTDPDIEIVGFKPIVKEIKDLKPESKVTGKMSIMIMAIGGGVLTAGLATAAVFIMRNRKKRML